MSLLTELPPNNNKHCTEAYRLFIKDHLNAIRKKAIEINLTHLLVTKYDGNTAGLYLHHDIPFKYHQVTDLLNGISQDHPLTEKKVLLIPDKKQLDGFKIVANRE